MVKAGWSTAFWAGALKNDASGGATLRLAAAAASQADCHTQHRAAHMHGRTRVQRHPNGRKGNLPVRTHRKPEVIRATMLEDSPCLPCGLCCTLLAHEVPGSGAGHGCHLAVADDHRPAHLAVGLFEVSLGPRANTKYDLD